MPVDVPGSVSLADAPGVDTPFDDLFPVEDVNLVQTQPEPKPATSQEPPQPEPVKPAPEFNFKTRTGTVYKSLDDAVKGTEEKDTQIAQMRSKMIALTGIDPITNRPVEQQSEPQVRPSYIQNRKKYYEDLVKNVNDPERYADVQTQFVYDAFQPYAPLLLDVAKQRATEEIATEAPQFREFRNSENYAKTLEAVPLLKDAIQRAENDLSAYSQLKDLYRLAYMAGQGNRVAETIQTAHTSSTVQPNPPSRPTTSPSTMTPPQQGPAPNLRTSEGRKQLIRDLENKGIGDFKF